MLILFTFLVVLSAVITISVILKTRKDRNYLTSKIKNEIEPVQFQSLFEPDEAAISALEREEKAKIEAQKAEKLREFQGFWEMSPNRRSTAQLLNLAAQTESGKLFSETAESVIKHWQANKIEDLSAANLAHILESRFRLLPGEERTAGVSFRINQEIVVLRRSSLNKK